MIHAYHTHQRVREAWDLYQEMKRSRIALDKHTLSTVLSIIADMSASIHEGKAIHQQLKVSKIKI